MPKSTPYWGVLKEFDILPIKLLLTYKKLMLYHNVVNSDEGRVARKIIEEQEKNGHEKCWYGNVKEEGERIGIEVNKKKVEGMMKSKWKKEVKGKVKEEFEKEIMDRSKREGKMRFLQTKGVNTYLKHVFNDDAKMALKIR